MYCLQRHSPGNGHTHFCAPRRATNSVRKSSKSHSPANRLGLTTKSNPVGIAAQDVRRISLTLLLTRFLSCALPSFRGVVKPKRLYGNPFGSANTTNERDTRFVPPSYTFLKSIAVLRRKDFGNLFVPVSGTISKALVVLNRNPFATLVSSALQYKPSASRFHPCSKTVRFGAAAIVRLVRPLWHSQRSSKNFKCSMSVSKKQRLSSLKTWNGSATLSRPHAN